MMQMRTIGSTTVFVPVSVQCRDAKEEQILYLLLSFFLSLIFTIFAMRQEWLRLVGSMPVVEMPQVELSGVIVSVILIVVAVRWRMVL